MSWLLGNWGSSSGSAGAGGQPPLGGGSGGVGGGENKDDASSSQQTFSVQETKVTSCDSDKCNATADFVRWF